MSTVFVINKSCHEFGPAKEYGQLVFMTEGALDRFNTSKMFRSFKPFIDRSQPEDYLLLTGMTVMNAVACAMFSHKHGRLNLLIFKERKGGEGQYLEKTIVF